MTILNKVQGGHTLVLWGGTWDDEYARRENVPDSEVVTVFEGLHQCAVKRCLNFFRIKLDGRSYTRQEFMDMVHAVNEHSTYHGGAPIY